MFQTTPISEPSVGETLRRRDLLMRGAAGVGALTLGSVLDACGAGEHRTRLVGANGRYAGGGKPVSLVTFGVEQDAVSMDYTQSYDFAGLLVMSAMTEQLLRMDQSRTLRPNLATSWDISNPLKIVFQIRPHVRFWDSTPLSADDVAFSLNRHRDPAVASLMAFYFANVASIKATGPLEVTISMKQPDAQLIEAMSMSAGAVTSRAFCEKHGKAFGTPAVGTLGTGPYRFVNWTKGQSYTVARNDDYWNSLAVPRHVRTYTAHVIPDESTLIAALQAGSIDGQLAQLSGRGVSTLASTSSIQQYPAPCSGGSVVNLNANQPPWNDARVRQALSLVIPRQGLLDSVWGGQGTLTKSVCPPTVWGYAPNVFQAAYKALPDYTHTGPSGSTLARARQLISQAGAHGAAGYLEVDTSYDAQQAEAIQTAAAKLGLHLAIHQVTASQLGTDSFSTSHPYAGAIGLSYPDFPDPANLLYLFFRSRQPTNPTGYSDPQVDALLNEQERLVNQPQQRARLLTRVQAIVTESQVMPVLVSPYLVLSLNRRLGGYQMASPQFLWDCHRLGSLSGR